MVRVIHATYNGSVLHPEEPLPFAPNTPLHVVVTDDPAEAAPASFLEATARLNLEGPEDWSSNFDHYLYGHRTSEPAT